MRNIYMSTLPFFFLFLCLSSSCEPRIELDRGQWGNKAEITGVNLFVFQKVTNKLNYKEEVTGYQRKTVTAEIKINKDSSDGKDIGKNPKVTITVASDVDLKTIGVRISHYADRVEPLSGAPKLGIITDFSGGSFKYRLYSADKSVRDWTLEFNKSTTTN